MHTGGCYCKAIRYQVPDQICNSTNCHCTICRATTGAPLVAWFTVPTAAFLLLSGRPTAFRSSAHATRTFCSTCGTQLTFVDDATPDEIDVTTCSLDAPDSVPPDHHIFFDDKVAWLAPADGLPRYRRGRSEGEVA
jgi:hypothetical protein